MKAALTFIVALAVCGGMPHAQADIDHQCLKQCVGTGASTKSCLSQCVYGDPVSTHMKENTHALPSHRVMSTPLPLAANELVPHVKTPTVADVPKNYACFNQCLKGGMAYGLCDKACGQPACSKSTPVCHDVTRVINGTPSDTLLPVFMRSGTKPDSPSATGTK